MKVRLGITGLGHRGMQLLTKVAAMPDVDIVALADLSVDRRETAAREFGVSATFELLSELLHRVRVDAVMVLTPDAAHYPQTMAALNAGVHVFVEKPPAYTVAEVEDMEDAAKKAGKHIMVAWNRTYGLEHVKKVFGDSGPEVVMLDMARENPSPMALLRNHAVDPLYYLCGMPSEVTAVSQLADAHQEGNVSASIRFQSGAIGQMLLSYGAGGYSERMAAFGNGHSVFVENTNRPTIRILKGREEVETVSPGDTIELELRHFIDCVVNGREPITSGRAAVDIMKFTWKIMEAAGFGIVDADEERGWLLWCACGNRVVPNLDGCPVCGMEWDGWSTPISQVVRA